MKLRSLVKITKSLETALREIERLGLWDKNLRCKYAEYLVARILAERKHVVEILSERCDNTSADIFLSESDKLVEVKSSCFQEGNWADASFADGKQIKKGSFDYCVWVLFDVKTVKPKHFFVFTRNELEEIAKKRAGVGRHKTNQCLLLYAPRIADFRGYAKPLNIEKKLIASRTRFDFEDAWYKIK